MQRAAQVERLRDLHVEAASREARAKDADESERRGPFAWTPRPRSAVLVGDFNFRPDDPLHARLRAPFDAGVPAFRDAWAIVRPGEPHAPTLGLYDKAQWPGDPFTTDFVFVTDDLAGRVEAVTVNDRTEASDHQPLLLRMRDG